MLHQQSASAQFFVCELRICLPKQASLNLGGQGPCVGLRFKICKAVLDAKVSLYLPWQYDIDYDIISESSAQDLFAEQLSVREMLRGQDCTQWTIISTGIFMNFLFEPSFGVVNLTQNTVRGLGQWTNSVTVTAVEDIGRVVAEVVYASHRPRGIIYTAGRTIEYGLPADIVDRVSNKSVQRELWTVDHLKTQLHQDFENGLKKYRVVFAEGLGVSWPAESTFTSKNGMKLVDVETWLRRDMAKR